LDAEARSAVAKAFDALDAAALVIAPAVHDIARDGLESMSMLALRFPQVDDDIQRERMTALNDVRRLMPTMRAAIRAELGVDAERSPEPMT
jgi:hypothetical protein